MKDEHERIRQKVNQIMEQDEDTINKYIANYLHRTGSDIRNVKMVIERVITDTGYKTEYYIEPIHTQDKEQGE